VKAVVRKNKETGNAIITENNNHLVDVWFAKLPELSLINPMLKSITGVVETSLFYNMASKAIIAGKEGIKVIEKGKRIASA
ncbi:MAG: ribose-5-phosphate isomerase A, partial [Bacteroidota bacterium]|nr:ribose-5-phosphate isomerase A [Bacteroidota bacterium]